MRRSACNYPLRRETNERVRDAVRSVGEMAAQEDMADMIGGSAATSFVRRSEATVAGRVFIEWQMLDRAPQ